MPTSHLPSQRILLEHFEKRDPAIARIVREFGPLRLTRNKRYFYVLCKAIIAQQISTRAADSITARFAALFDGKSPAPACVFPLPDETLRAIGLSRQKTAYLKDLSRKFMDGSVRPHRLPYLTNEEVIDRLTAVHGIGRWTAEMFLIFSLNRLDVLPVGDLGLRTALKNIYRMRTLPSPQRIRAMGEKWRPYQTVATWYAWRTLDGAIIAY
ncbi:MAG: DNA-3-methyladenine glycosylase 2 family protein [Nitrospinae bacterium]|nr:DNA-3-methyladenine glycosylase 2 family protein [Nitrospinota bacterium]